jgi:hypothetical protein
MKTHKSLKVGIYLSALCIGLMLISCAGSGTPHTTKDVPQEIGELPVVYSGSIIFSEEASAHADLELFQDSTFLLLRRVNNDSVWNGVFGVWSLNGFGQVVLDAGRDAQLILEIMESSMLILNSEGERVDSDQQFVLNKMTNATLLNRRFIAKGEYFYMADAAIMRFCAIADKAWPVAMGGDNLSVERFFLKEISARPGQKIFVEAEISILFDSGMEGNPRTHILIHEFLGGSWQSDCY